MDIAKYKKLEEAGLVNKVVKAGSDGDTYAIFYDEYDSMGVKTTKVEGINKAKLFEEKDAHLKAAADIDAFVAVAE